MRCRIIKIALNLLSAAFIGLLVGIGLLFVYTVENPVHHLATSSLTGVMIGAVCNISAILMYQYGCKNLSWSYLLTSMVTLVGSVIASWGEPLRSTFVALAIAEPFAVLITFMNIKYIGRLNDGLKRKQAQLQQKNELTEAQLNNEISDGPFTPPKV